MIEHQLKAEIATPFTSQEFANLQKIKANNPEVRERSFFEPKIQREQLLDSWLEQVKNPINPLAEKHRWWHLEGTGFSIVKQVNRLIRDYHHYLDKGTEHDQALEKSLKAVRKDVAFLNSEYFQRNSVIWFDQDIEMVNGQPFLKDSSYNSKPMVEMINPNERNGAVLGAIFEVGKILHEAPVGSFVVSTSPPGDSGLETDHGKNITYPDSQTWIWQKQVNGGLKAATIITSMDSSQNIEFLKSLGALENLLRGSTEEETAENIVRSVQLIKSSEEIKSFADVLQKIEDARGSKIAREFKDEHGNIKKVTFDELRSALEPAQEVALDSESTNILEQFNSFVRSNPHLLLAKNINSMEKLAKEMGKSVLRVKMVTDRLKEDPLNLPKYIFKPSESDYRKALKGFQLIGGCNGGGLEMGVGFAIQQTLGISKLDRDYCIQCGACGKVINKVVKAGQRCPAGCGAVRKCA